MFFTTAFLNTVSTIAAESSDVASASSTDAFSNDQDSVEVEYYKTKQNERSSLQDPITKCNDVKDTQKTTTENNAANVLLEIKIREVRHELKEDLKTDFVLLGSTEDTPK